MVCISFHVRVGAKTCYSGCKKKKPHLLQLLLFILVLFGRYVSRLILNDSIVLENKVKYG